MPCVFGRNGGLPVFPHSLGCACVRARLCARCAHVRGWRGQTEASCRCTTSAEGRSTYLCCKRTAAFSPSCAPPPAEAEGRRLPMPPLPCRRSSLRCHRPWRLHRAAKAALGATVFVACLHFPSAGCVERQCGAWRRGLHRCHRTPVRLMPCRAMLCRAVPRRDGQTASNTAAGISATCVLTSAIDTMATLFAATVIFGEGRRVTRRSSVPVPSPSARPPASSLARFCNRVSRARARRTWRCGTAT